MPVLFSIARATARGVIPALQKAGYSATQGLRLLMREGYGYRKTDFLGDWREFYDARRLRPVVSRLPLDRKPDLGLMTKKASPVGGKFTYRFECRMKDPVTGRTKIDLYGVTTDDHLTPRQALEETKSKIVEGKYEPYYEFIRGRLITVLRR